MIRAALLALAALVLASCGGLEEATGMRDPFGTPQPFRGSGDPGIIGGVMGERPVYVGAIAGLTPEDEAALRKAIATNAAALDVLASAEMETAGSLTLTGTASPGRADFTLSDGEAPLGRFGAEGDLSLIAVGAARALADALGRLGAPPPQQAAEGAASRPTPAAYVREIKTPEKGQAEPLRRAVIEGLARLGVRMKDAAAEDTYAITGALTLGPDQGGRMEVIIVWTVFAPDGRNLGMATQENALATAAVRKTWAEQAALAGGAAANSIAQIMASDFGKAR